MVVIGVPMEIKDNENRVGLTPAGVAAYVHAGCCRMLAKREWKRAARHKMSRNSQSGGTRSMGFPYRRLMEAIRFFLLFITCALISYGLIKLLTDRLLPADPYHEPYGNAVKVVKLINAPPSQDLSGYVNRLQLFYLTGE